MKNTIVRCVCLWSVLLLMLPASSLPVTAFEGGGGGFFFGTGFPGSIDAADDLADDLGINERKGNVTMGALGFYQADTYRLGASFQFTGWGGWNVNDDEVDDDTAGVAAMTAGFYGTWTIRKDRLLMNLGAIVGAGRVALGYNYGDYNDNYGRQESTSVLYFEPQFSVGVAAARWVGFEFMISAPLYAFDEDLVLTVGGVDYSVNGKDLSGVVLSMRFIFGLVADL